MQKGFIFPSLYIYLGLGLIVLGLGIAVKVQSARLESCKAEHKAFVANVERLGLEAKEKAKQVEAQDKLRKEVADENLRKLRIANSELSKRVRDDSNRGFLSSGEASTRIPESACLNAGAVDQALRDFTGRVAELIIEGQSAITDLDNAKRWSQSQ